MVHATLCSKYVEASEKERTNWELKLLCSVRTEKAFEEKLADLEKDMNERAKEWLKGEMVDKDKWALAYDDGGWRYGIMTTNNAESVNNIFKGIRSRPVAGIVEFSFEKLNEYFVDRWGKARSLLDKGEQWGLIAHEHLGDAENRSVNQLAAPYGPERMIYGVRGAGGTNIGEGICRANTTGATSLLCRVIVSPIPVGTAFFTCWRGRSLWSRHY